MTELEQKTLNDTILNVICEYQQEIGFLDKSDFYLSKSDFQDLAKEIAKAITETEKPKEKLSDYQTTTNGCSVNLNYKEFK